LNRIDRTIIGPTTHAPHLLQDWHPMEIHDQRQGLVWLRIYLLRHIQLVPTWNVLPRHKAIGKARVDRRWDPGPAGAAGRSVAPFLCGRMIWDLGWRCWERGMVDLCACASCV
jgi:hypothetical protein